MKERYFVDQRGGCIAVRDRELTDPEYNGLHHDTEGVVKFWEGKRIEKTCPCCGHTNFSHWEVLATDIVKACALCKELNETNPDSNQT